MTLALARKYRPKRFDDVAVQSHVSNTLKGAIERGRVAHGYLLCGPRGVGKTTLARVLAMALNCPNKQNGEPCGVCQSCERIWNGSASLDVVEIDAASNRGVDDARELRERAMYAPSGDDGYKVYIVDEAHMLTREAWNALLKILEEPPPRVVFVFATTEPQKIAQSAAPVLSRLQRFDFKRIGPGEVRDRLKHVLAEEKIAAEPEALSAIARAADGSMRDALSLTDQVLSMGDGKVTVDRVRDALGLVAEDEFIAILDLIADKRAGEVFGVVSKLADAGVDFASLLTGLADILRAQLAITLGGDTPELSEMGREALKARKGRIAAADLLRMLNVIGEVEQRFKRSGQQQMLIETLLVRFALLERTVEIDELLKAMDGGARKSVGPSVGPRSVGQSVGPSVGAADRPSDRPIDRSTDRPSAQSTDRPSSGASSRVTATGAVRVPERALAPAEPLEINRIAERWDDLIAQLRDASKQSLASALQHSSPVVVNAKGELTVELDEPNDFYDHALSHGRAEMVERLRTWFPSLEKVIIRGSEKTPAGPPKRLTDEMVRAERLASLKKQDPVLNAAIEHLDLDIVD